MLLNENDTSVYTRTLGDEKIYVVCRYADTEDKMPECIPDGCTVILNNYNSVGDSLKPYQAIWFKK